MLPKYERIKQDIISLIETGEFKPGNKIYSEGDLKKRYSVSNTTVVKALNDLVSQGYLIRKQGEGTFVRRNLVHKRVLFTETSPTAMIKGTKEVMEKTVTSIDKPFHDSTIAKQLNDKTGEKALIKIVQIALVNDQPWKIQNRYILAEKLDDIALDNLKNGGSLSEELHLTKNMTDLPTKIDISTVLLTKDAEELSPIMELNENYLKQVVMSLFDLRKITYDLKGKPIEYSQSFIFPEYYHIEIMVE